MTICLYIIVGSALFIAASIWWLGRPDTRNDRDKARRVGRCFGCKRMAPLSRFGFCGRCLLDMGGESEPEEFPGYPRHVVIVCPQCDTVQAALVHFTREMPAPSRVHQCDECGYTTMESEWELIREAE